MDKLDRLLKDISTAIDKHLEEAANGGNKDVTAVIEAIKVDPNAPIYKVAVDALHSVGGKARAKELQTAVRKIYNRRVSRSQIYMALDYVRRTSGDVRRKRGVWEVQEHARVN